MGSLIALAFIVLLVAMFLVIKYCKNKALKIGLAVFIGLLTLYTVMFSVDYIRIVSFKKPVFVIPWGADGMGEYFGQTYRGLGYEIDMATFKIGDRVIYTQMMMAMFNRVIVVDITSEDNFTIVDETESSDQALEFIHEDNHYRYYLTASKSEAVFIVFVDGERMSVREALAENSFSWGRLLVQRYPDMFYSEPR